MMQDWVCLRKSKVFTNAHTEKLNQETLDIFFDMLYEILYNGFLEDANAVYCIFDTSESGFAADPNWRKMLFKKSTKENQLLIPACSKAMSTVVFFRSCLQRASFVWVRCENGQEGTVYSNSPSGWMTEANL